MKTRSLLARIFHQWSVTRAFQGASSAAFATAERAGVLDRYIEHSDRAKAAEDVLWDGRSRSTGEIFGLTLSALLLVVQPGWAQGLDGEALRRAISGPDREVTDFVRDPVRRPVEVLQLLGIEPGMQVLDVYAAGGYYTFILSKAVGPEGKVFAQNTPRGLRFEEDRQEVSQGEALEEKIRRGNLSNVTHLVERIEELSIAPESLDAIMVVQILHDYYNGNPGRAVQLLGQLKDLLKPGGVVGVIDHVGEAGRENRRFHRMEKQQAIDAARQAGFELVADSDLLHNPADRHVRSVFDPALQRNTDRFLLKLQKPE
jgi:predicted methyltransferase